MKKLVLRKWVINVLTTISFIAVLFMASECDNTKIFIISHFIALGVFIGCVLIIKKFGSKKLFD